MTGIVGGSLAEDGLGSMLDVLDREPWYDEVRFERQDYSLGLVHHGENDPTGWHVWEQGERAGVVNGVFTTPGTAPPDADALFESMFDDPSAALARIDGPFTIACVDFETGQVILATDKIGSRPCYYSDEDGLVFGSELGALLRCLDGPQLDERAVSDVLLMGYVWGEKTLLDGVRRLPPATVLVHEDGDTTTRKYWKPDFSPRSTAGYTSGLVRRYRQAMADISTTVEGTAGLFLSGGLDSRAVAGELRRQTGSGNGLRDLVAYTYDSNPRGGGNPELARRVAATLDIDIDTVEITPETFLENVGTAVDLTDGMLRWSSAFNLLSVYELPDPAANVLFEGTGLGELLGVEPRRRYFERFDSAADAMYDSEAITDADTVQAIMTPAVAPRRSFERAVETSDEETHGGRLLDIYFENHLPRMAYASDAIPQSRTDTRVPFVHGEFLDYVAGVPLNYRMGSIPFTDGAIPYGVTRSKLGLSRRLDPELARIPYERTGLPPTYPFAGHVLGFVATTGFARLSRANTYGGRSVLDEWYRDHSGVRSFIDDLLRDACERPLFDADEIRRLRREHLEGERNHMVGLLASITTLELWLQRHLD